MEEICLLPSLTKGSIGQMAVETPNYSESLLEERIRSEQVHQLYGAIPAVLPLSLTLGLVLVVAQWQVIPHLVLGGWLLTHMVVSGMRMWLGWAYRRWVPSPAESLQWLRYFLYSALLAGCVWGAAGVLLFPEGDAFHLTILAIALAGVSAGGIISLSAFWPAALAFLVPTLLPFLIRNLVADFVFSMPMAEMTGLFSATLGLMSRRISQNIRDNIRLRLDATRQKEALQTYQAVFEQSRDTVILMGRNMIRECNQAALELFRVADMETFCTYHPADLSPTYQPDGQTSWQAASHRIEEAFSRGRAFFEWHHKSANGVEFPAEVLLSRIDLTEDSILQAVVRDISQQKRLEARLEYQAFHDALTGLPNRALLKGRLDHALEYAHRHKHKIALLFCDLDNFKDINDNLGHSMGDRLLQALTERISKVMREEDTLARQGGDEFIVCLEQVASSEDALNVSQRILMVVAEPFELEGHRIQSTCSIGISLYPQDSTTAEELFSHADFALYQAKAAGRNTACLYDADHPSSAAVP